MMRGMKKYFFAGLATLLPLAVTFWIVQIVVNFLTKPFTSIVASFLLRFPFPLSAHGVKRLSQFLVLVGIFLFTLALGFVARRLFFNKLIQFGDQILKKIPLVNKVYKTSKEIVVSLFGTDKPAFKQAVLIPFPYPGCYCIGIVTSDSPKTCNESSGESMSSIFIPTTPNPATGFLIMVPQKDLIYLDIKADEAIKYVVSCAVIQPGETP